jgi:hypothetical protein
MKVLLTCLILAMGSCSAIEFGSDKFLINLADARDPFTFAKISLKPDPIHIVDVDKKRVILSELVARAEIALANGNAMNALAVCNQSLLILRSLGVDEVPAALRECHERVLRIHTAAARVRQRAKVEELFATQRIIVSGIVLSEKRRRRTSTAYSPIQGNSYRPGKAKLRSSRLSAKLKFCCASEDICSQCRWKRHALSAHVDFPFVRYVVSQIPVDLWRVHICFVTFSPQLRLVWFCGHPAWTRSDVEATVRSRGRTRPMPLKVPQQVRPPSATRHMPSTPESRGRNQPKPPRTQP